LIFLQPGVDETNLTLVLSQVALNTIFILKNVLDYQFLNKKRELFIILQEKKII